MGKSVYVKRSRLLQSGDLVVRHYLATISDQRELENLISKVISEDQIYVRDFLEITEPHDAMLNNDYVLLLSDRNDNEITDILLIKVMTEIIKDSEIPFRHDPEVDDPISIAFIGPRNKIKL
jgi:hypothetical protein